jgi:hypothetical protein
MSAQAPQQSGSSLADSPSVRYQSPRTSRPFGGASK